MHRGSEVRGFAEPSTNITAAAGNGNKFEMLQPFTGFSPRRNRHKSRSLSLVTWDSDAKLAIGMYHVQFLNGLSFIFYSLFLFLSMKKGKLKKILHLASEHKIYNK